MSYSFVQNGLVQVTVCVFHAFQSMGKTHTISGLGGHPAENDL